MSEEFTESDEESKEYAKELWNQLYQRVETEGIEKLPEILTNVTPHDLKSLANYAIEVNHFYRNDAEQNQYLIEAPIAKAIIDKLSTLEHTYSIHQENTQTDNPMRIKPKTVRNQAEIVGRAPILMHQSFATAKPFEAKFVENPLQSAGVKKEAAKPELATLIAKTELNKQSHLRKIVPQVESQQVASQYLQAAHVKTSEDVSRGIKRKINKEVSTEYIQTVQQGRNSPTTVAAPATPPSSPRSQDDSRSR